MRPILSGLAATVIILTVEIPTVSAQPGGTRNPYCIRDGRNWQCTFRTMAQCRASASGVGGWCVRNPWYKGRSR